MSTYWALRCDCDNLCYKNRMTEPDCEICNSCEECCDKDNHKEKE